MYKPGLKGVTAVETKLSFINGKEGELFYRDIPIKQIVENKSFEETTYYLLNGVFPTCKELIEFQTKLKLYRQISDYIKNIIDQLPLDLPIMDVLRTAISSITLKTHSYHDNAIQLIAAIPSIIAYRYRKMNHLAVVEAKQDYNHVENFMYMLRGEVNRTHAQILETYLIMTMEHGLNASTFSARVTMSTESDLVSAITSAIGTMKGPLHGGAPSGVIDLLNEIRTEDHISEVIHSKLKNKERIMGFGHRVYKTVDPRAMALKERILQINDLPAWINLALKTEEEAIKILKQYKPDHKLYTNVEYYAAAIMKSLNIDSTLFTAIFSSSRIVGWCAHAIEQAKHNTIFRPSAKYIGN